MYTNGGQNGYAPGQTQTGAFPAVGFAPASTLAGGGQNPFSSTGFPQQPAAPNPFQSSYSQGSSHPAPFSSSSNPPSSFPPSSSFPRSQAAFPTTSSFPAAQTYPATQTHTSFPNNPGKGTVRLPYKEGFERDSQIPTPILHIGNMSPYQSQSTEELRLEDYQYNNKHKQTSTFSAGPSGNPFQHGAGAAGNAGETFKQQGGGFGQRLGGANPFAGGSQTQFQSGGGYQQGFQTQSRDGFGFQASGFPQARGQSEAPTPPKSSFGSVPASSNPFSVPTHSVFPTVSQPQPPSFLAPTTPLSSSFPVPQPPPSTAFPLPQSQPSSSFFISQSQPANKPTSHPFAVGDTNQFTGMSLPAVPAGQFPLHNPATNPTVLPSTQPTHFPMGAAFPPHSGGMPQAGGGQTGYGFGERTEQLRGFQPHPVASVSPIAGGYYGGDGGMSFTQGFRDPLGLGWLFPNGVPEELRMPRYSLYPAPRFSPTEELLRSKAKAVSRAAEDSMSSLWRRSRCPRPAAKPLISAEMRPAATACASVFSKKPFREIKFEAANSGGMFELKRTEKESFMDRINDGCDRQCVRSGDIGLKSVESKENLSAKKASTADTGKKERVGGVAPKLTKKGYYMLPGEQEMRAMTSEELRRVRDFTVGNEFGKLVFDGETDVEGLSLDDLIVIEHKAVIMYPEPAVAKPLIGQSLNKPATIHLYNCTPRSPQTSPLSFELKIRKVCERNHSHFLSYDHSTGEWIFRVDHF